jgi:hypothetical protein
VTPGRIRESVSAFILLAAICSIGCTGKGPVVASTGQPSTLPDESPSTKPAGPKFVDSLKSGKYFAVAVEQDGQHIAISAKDRTATLNKAPFALIFTFMGTGPGVVATNVSLDSDSYEAVLAGKDINEVPGLEGTGMAEGTRNGSKEFFIRPKCFHYWYYDDPKDNRFDKVAPGADRIVCRRSVRQCKRWGPDGRGGPSTPISQIEGKVLYFVFARFRKNSYSPKIGLQLDCLKIRWR